MSDVNTYKKLSSDKIIFYIRVAETIVEVHSLFQDSRTLCKNYLIEDDATGSAADFIIDIVPRNIRQENDESQKILNTNSESIYLYFNPGYMETFAVHRKLCESIPKYGAFLMHGAVVAYKGFAYMFIAPSGTGKSTRVKLWIDEYPESIVVNGDKPFLRVTDKKVYAYGSPWCGKEHWNTNIGVPLKAMYLLERSDEDQLEEIPFKDAFAKLLNQTYIPSDPSSSLMTLSLLRRMSGKVQIYRFRSTPTRTSVRYAYETANL